MDSRSIRLLTGSLLALAAIFAIEAPACTPHCGGGACMQTVDSRGSTGVPLSDTPDLEIERCMAGECTTTELTRAADGSVTCDGLIHCALTAGTDGNWRLEINDEEFALGTETSLDPGNKVHVRVTRKDTQEVVIDRLATVEPAEGPAGECLCEMVLDWGP